MRHWAGPPVLRRRAEVYSPSLSCAQTGFNLAGLLNSPPPRSHVTPPLCRRPFDLHPALPAHAQSPFTAAPLGEDILQKVRDWQAAPNPKPPTEFRAGHVTPRKLGKDALKA